MHFIPFVYHVLHTFPLHQMMLDVFMTRSDSRGRQRIDGLYIVVSVLVWRSQR